MKRFLILLILVNTFLSAHASTEASNDTLKIISYNIWNGFEWGKDNERKERFVGYIKKEAPDVLALQELCGFTQESLAQLAKQWGHNYAIIHKEGGYPVGITSTKPISLVKKINENCGHGMLHVKTHEYDMIVTHLNPFNAEKRLVEANTILNYMDSVKLTTRTFLMGDLNAHSPFDADFLETHNMRISKKRKPENGTNGRFDYAVISRVISYPLIDVCQKFIPVNERESFPTLVFSPKDRSFEARDQERIDYIFVTPDIEKQLINAYVANRGITDYLSDHYPVIVELLRK